MSELSAAALRASLREAGIDLSSSKTAFLCAVSGGLDSMVLVHLLQQLGLRLRAIHVDHAAHNDSAEWAKWVCQQLAALKINVSVHRLEASGVLGAGNLEEQWRDARRAVFLTELKVHEILVTAHHQDDQVETLLLQLLRGAGPAGLQAMPLVSEIVGADNESAYHVRPLLAHPRAELERFAHSQGIQWLDDPSNTNERFARNFLRHTILPQIYARWPGAGAAIARSRALMAQSATLNEVLAAQDATISDNGYKLDWGALEAFDVPRQANVVRYWLQLHAGKLPSHRRLTEALRQWQHAREDRLPTLELPEGTVQRYRSHLVFAPTVPEDAEQWTGAFCLGERLKLPCTQGELNWAKFVPSGSVSDAVPRPVFSSAALKGRRMTVRYRRAGEKLRRKAGHHQSLKHWFQQHGVPPIWRNRLPLVFLEDELIAIADIWIDARFRIDQDSAATEKDCWLMWRKPEVGKAK